MDSSGRRGRLTRRAGAAAAGLLALYLAVVGVSLVSGADVPLTPQRGSGGETTDPARSGIPDASTPPGATPTARSTSGPAPAADGGGSSTPDPPAPATTPAPAQRTEPGNGKGNGDPSPPGWDRRPTTRPGP